MQQLLAGHIQGIYEALLQIWSALSVLMCACRPLDVIVYLVGGDVEHGR